MKEGRHRFVVRQTRLLNEGDGNIGEFVADLDVYEEHQETPMCTISLDAASARGLANALREIADKPSVFRRAAVLERLRAMTQPSVLSNVAV